MIARSVRHLCQIGEAFARERLAALPGIVDGATDGQRFFVERLRPSVIARDDCGEAEDIQRVRHAELILQLTSHRQSLVQVAHRSRIVTPEEGQPPDPHSART